MLIKRNDNLLKILCSLNKDENHSRQKKKQKTNKQTNKKKKIQKNYTLTTVGGRVAF